MTDLLPHDAVIDLSNCAREPIHTPGHIQAHGALFVLDANGALLQRSDNASDFASDALGPGWLATLPDVLRVPLNGCLQNFDALRDDPHLLFADPTRDVLVHARHGRLMVEFEAVTADARYASETALERSRRVLQKLRAHDDLDDYCQALADEVRELSGYDRVMIYRFAEDWHGWVSQESMREGLAPFLGLHYPASDIPSQARALFLKNPIRMLPDCAYEPVALTPPLLDGAPVDMSHTFLRGASRMYTEYLENMGVRATLTMGIPRDGQLWGMIACHHYDAPRAIPHAERAGCELIAHCASTRISEILSRTEIREARLRMKRHAALVQSFSEELGLEDALVANGRAIAAIVDSDACVIASYVSGEMRVLAATEDRPEVGILQSVFGRVSASDDDLFETASLVELGLPDSSVAGALGIPVAPLPGTWIVWFRREQAHTVRWAGDPHKPVTVGPLGSRLTPRESFAEWTQSVRGKSNPWGDGDRDAASLLRVMLGDAIHQARVHVGATLARLDAREDAVDTFASLISHDLRQPLRGIRGYANILREDASDRLGDAIDSVDHIERLAQRMSTLIEGLFAHARVDLQRPNFRSIALRDVVDDVLHDLWPEIEKRGATIRVLGDLGTVHCTEIVVREVFANLIGNALKYTDEPPVIEIGLRDESNLREIVFFVRDFGIGVPLEHHQSIFQMFQRLYPDGRYGEGTGTGLPLVRKLVERLGGGIELDRDAENTTFVVRLPEQGL